MHYYHVMVPLALAAVAGQLGVGEAFVIVPARAPIQTIRTTASLPGINCHRALFSLGLTISEHYSNRPLCPQTPPPAKHLSEVAESPRKLPA